MTLGFSVAYVDQYKDSLSLYVFPFLFRVLRYYGITLPQLQPNGFRVVVAFYLHCLEMNVLPLIGLFRAFFILKAVSPKGWFSFPLLVSWNFWLPIRSRIGRRSSSTFVSLANRFLIRGECYGKVTYCQNTMHPLRVSKPPMTARRNWVPNSCWLNWPKQGSLWMVFFLSMVCLSFFTGNDFNLIMCCAKVRVQSSKEYLICSALGLYDRDTQGLYLSRWRHLSSWGYSRAGDRCSHYFCHATSPTDGERHREYWCCCLSRGFRWA